MALYPNKGMTSEDLILKQWIPAGFQVNCPFRVRIPTVVSPSDFWIQFDDPQYTGVLRKMEKEMKMFYMENGEDMLLKGAQEITRHTYAVIQFNQGFRRVAIRSLHEVEDRQYAAVFHMDHGLYTRIETSKLLILHHKFSYFPQQAIWATLAHVVPVDGGTHWDSDVCDQFGNILEHCTLQATIVGMVKNKYKLHLILEDISNIKEDININDYLVSRELAETGVTINFDT